MLVDGAVACEVTALAHTHQLCHALLATCQALIPEVGST